MKLISIQIKIVSVIILVLLVTIGISLFLTINNQKKDLISATQKTLYVNTEMLDVVIRSIMLTGEAPIAEITMSNLQGLSAFKKIAIYKTDGTTAFNDYKTLDFVNNYQKKFVFQKTQRLLKETITNHSFQKVLETSGPVQVELVKDRQMEYFYPILNSSECWDCHSRESGQIRGIAHFKISLAGVYKQINTARNNLILLYSAIGIIIALFLIVLMNRIIIRPIKQIGSGVNIFEKGNLDTSIILKSRDELGDLAQKINKMIKGLKERNQLMLSNRVFEARIEESKKYLDNIQEGLLLLNKDLSMNTEYSQFLTVLFGQSEIAGKNFLDFIYPDPEKEADKRVELGKFIDMIFNNTLTEMDMIMSINPLQGKTLRVGVKDTGGERDIVVDTLFQRIMNGAQVENVMVIFEDMTKMVQIENELKDEKLLRENEIQHIASILRAGPEAFNDFINEMNKILNELDDNLNKLEDKEIVNKLFRQMHSLKGTARYLEFGTIERITHETEGYLSEIRDGKVLDFSQHKIRIKELIQKFYEEIEGIKRINEKFRSFNVPSQQQGADAGDKNLLAGFLGSLDRMAADIAKELKKNIALTIENHLEEFPHLTVLKNPIIHLIRNAIDHGIEDNFERLSLGKPEKGQIALKLNLDDSKTSYVIELEDDGKGIDFTEIKKIAVERGLLPKSDAEPDHAQLLNILFSPSFSSKKEVSRISGRGVGLDIVKLAVNTIHGHITITTKLHKGTRITIQIPV